MSDNAVYDRLDAAAGAVAAREVNTAARIADQLRSLKLDEVRTGIAGHGEER